MHLALDAAIGRETQRAVLAVFDQEWLVVAAGAQLLANDGRRDSAGFPDANQRVLVDCETLQRQQILVPSARHAPAIQLRRAGVQSPHPLSSR
jgi:hypothetical protein